MADRIFEEVLEKRMFWVERNSSFSRCSNRIIVEDWNSDMKWKNSGAGNMNKRMIEFMRRNWAAMAAVQEPERERCHRHMISERNRREKQKQNYSALHALLPDGTKTDKNSVIQAAAVEIQRLQSTEEELTRFNSKLESTLAFQKHRENDGGGVKIRVRHKMANPASGVNSVLEVLRCLKTLGVKIKAVQSEISALELSVVLEMEPMMVGDPQNEPAEVEKAVYRSLHEAERKLLCNNQALITEA